MGRGEPSDFEQVSNISTQIILATTWGSKVKVKREGLENCFSLSPRG